MARIIGFFASLLFMSLVIDEGLDRFRHSDPILFKFIPWLVLALAGYILAWFKPTLGGMLALFAGVLMFSFHLGRLDWFTAIVYGLPFIIVGVLFIVSEPVYKERSQDSMP